MSARADLSMPTSGGLPSQAGSSRPLREISFADPAVAIERRADGTIYLRPKTALDEYPARLTERLHHWADATPQRIFMAEREVGGGWRKITYFRIAACQPAHRLEPFGTRSFG